ncbi:MAG TPA: hypothetical protein VK737_01150 [Opitutales bacterium]|jgi:hypothetical protein|nr:hypothetical protein [Opitutales bacterium]
MPAPETYFITWKGKRDGPYTLEQLADLLERGDIGLLHRVETRTGLVPLRHLLLPPTPASPLGALPVSPTLENTSPTIEESPDAAPMPTEFLAPEDATRAYTLCGLCFVFPPLIYRALAASRELALDGFPQTAQRVQWLSIGLTGSGVVFWFTLLWYVFARR